MGLRVRHASVCAIVVLAAVAASGGEEHPNKLPESAAEAWEWAKPLIDPARAAKSAETPEIAKGIRRAIDWMQPWSKSGAVSPEWSAAWNEALTLTRFHKNKPTGEYILDPKHLDGNYVEFGLVQGRGWSAWLPELKGVNSGLWGEISHTLDGRLAAKIGISVYTFDVRYFDKIDGANTAELAKRQIEHLRSLLKTVDSISNTVTAKPCSKAFTRSQYVEAVGTSEKDGKVRYRTYYVKGAYRTYELLVTEYRDVKETDSLVGQWQRTDDDPELQAVIASIEEGQLKKVR